MLMPGKHLKISESLFGLGGIILNILDDRAMNIDQIWGKIKNKNDDKEFPAYYSYENMILALDYLFMIGVIRYNDQGEVRKRRNNNETT